VAIIGAHSVRHTANMNAAVIIGSPRPNSADEGLCQPSSRYPRGIAVAARKKSRTLP